MRCNNIRHKKLRAVADQPAVDKYLLSNVHTLTLEAGVDKPTNQHHIVFSALTLLVEHQ